MTGDVVDLSVPDYAGGALQDVLPSVAHSLGCPVPQGSSLSLTAAHRAVVVLVDGLGAQLLARRGGHAPFLRSLLPTGRSLTAGYPSTTATSTGSFGTGLPPGTHGLLGYEVRDPATGTLLNELSWEDGPDPVRWQRHATVLERVAAAGVAVTRIGPGFFDGSGLTNAALRGGRFTAASALADRVDAAVVAVRSSPRALVYLYWGDVDKVGHVHGCDSWQWGEEVESTDAELGRLARSLPRDTSLTITADHGMVDVPVANRLDMAHVPGLAEGVAMTGGEPRAPQLYVDPAAGGEAAQAVADRWRDVLGDRAWVRTRAEAVSEGWFGAVDPQLLPRIGDVVVAMRGRHTVVDSRHHRHELISLTGVHGSLTDDEVLVPLLHRPAGST